MNAAVGNLLADKYRLIRMLGEGSAGEVWEAENTLVNRKVALKILRAEYAHDPEIRGRFIAEARAAGGIRHANVVDVFDLGMTNGGTPFMVMELCDGETLDAITERRGAVGVGYACELATQVLGALDAAHALGIVHRDLKPANIMVVHPKPEQPVIKVLDFGIAQGVHDERALPDEEGRVFGTPDYMAPEQASGDPVDHRADLYSVGAILYELLTGRAPFDGPTPEIVLANVLSRPPKPVRRYARSVPESLANVIQQALSKDPDERPQSARGMGRLLQAFLSLAPAAPAQSDGWPPGHAPLRPKPTPSSGRLHLVTQSSIPPARPPTDPTK